ncbi:MAG: hypothetical protein NT096_04905 [Proteobacteria bacterium]|nr:hypothetical protein [Pseudomonadota bacterium]
MSQMKFFDLINEIDLLLLRKPTDEDCLTQLVKLVTDDGLRRYFFDHLENPEWIGPLKSKGFFSNPPKPNRDEDRGTIGFPPWPESRYLARMASLSPETVTEVLLQIPDTDNVSVLEDLVDAALKMPPDIVARLVEKATEWARSPYQLLLPRKLGSLIAHFAKGGQVAASLDLAGILLEVLPDPTQKDKSETEGGYRLPPQPRARFDIWEYQKILEKDFPELVKLAGLPAFQLLCDLLETTVRLSQRRTDNKGPEDYSHIWRPAIEEHEQNQLYRLEDMLVSGVRDTAVFLAETKKTEVSELIKILEGRPWKIFWRMALHIIRLFSDEVPNIVASKLTDQELFDDYVMRHEYALLSDKCFGSLSPEQQQVILSWIKKAPDLQDFIESREQMTGKRPTDEDAEKYRKRWQLSRLSWFKRHLSGEWKQYYDSLLSELGEPEHPDFLSYSGATWVGPASPKSTEELQNMSVTDIVVFLQNWQHSGDTRAPSPDGLSRELSIVVAQEPRRFSTESPRFRGLDPTYVRGLIIGFRDALKQKRTFEWQPVFDLCQWAVKQPLDIQGQSNRMQDSDPDWGWTRRSIVDLLSSGFEEGEGCIHFDHRGIVWSILKPLTDDPDPTPEHEASYGGSNMDPTSLSINTTRGEAMHTVIRYALWVSRHFEKLPDGKKRLSRGFNEMPEVRTILEKHLDISQDPSLAIRSVYGQWFPWIVLLDMDWARNHTNQIFPSTESEKAFCEAAWDAYIVFCPPYDNVFGILRKQYIEAIKKLKIDAEEKRGLADPQERLAEHLMAYCWRGIINLKDPILTEFWERASDKVRGHAIAYVGENLHRWKKPVPPEILKRLRVLWETRVAIATSAPNNHKSEMAAFGWWFASKKFENKWAINQLIAALRLTGNIEPDHLVAECLASISQEMPRETLQCFELMIKGDQEGWRIYDWREHLRIVLSNTLQSSDPETVSAAEDFIHYLGSKGCFEFRDLLRSKRDSDNK